MVSHPSSKSSFLLLGLRWLTKQKKIDGGQKDALLRKANIKKLIQMSAKLGIRTAGF